MDEPRLFADADPTHAFALWHRPTRKQKWQVVGTAATERELVFTMVGSGEFVVLPVGKEPGARRQIGSETI